MYHESNEPITQRGHNRYVAELCELYRINRKKPIDKFILDFYCSKLLLAVEVDGGYHLGQKRLDRERDIKLSMIGIKTIRYTNDEVLKSLKLVVENIKDIINEL
ncbi:MAG: DUF559 domain-containing protein [Candidatus Shapirobacteria bacterium]